MGPSHDLWAKDSRSPGRNCPGLGPLHSLLARQRPMGPIVRFRLRPRWLWPLEESMAHGHRPERPQWSFARLISPGEGPLVSQRTRSPSRGVSISGQGLEKPSSRSDAPIWPKVRQWASHLVGTSSQPKFSFAGLISPSYCWRCVSPRCCHRPSSLGSGTPPRCLNSLIQC